MEAKREIEQKAKALINTSPDEAIKLYREIWASYTDQFNDWDAFFTIKALRASNKPDLSWASEIAEKYKNERVGNLYGWLLYDKCLKGKNHNELLSNEKLILKLPFFSLQKNLRDDDSFPCPTTISILKLTKEYSKPSFNAQKIEELLNHLNEDKLSIKPTEKENTATEKEDEFASDFEKYVSLKTKALFKLGKFIECKELCKKALETLTKFHYNNETWLKMRIALSEEKLGNHDISEHLLKELLTSKAGNDKWFLYKDISEIYYEQGDFEKAWKHSIDAAFYGNEPHFLIGLYLLQSRILFKLKRPDEGKILAELIAAILKEQKWNDKIEYNKLFDYFNINRQSLPTINDCIIEAKKLWTSERYGRQQKFKGTVISIHKNGKIGRIKDQKGNIIGFHKKDLTKKTKSIENLIGASVEFFEMKSYDGKNVAENINILELQQNLTTNNLVGKIFDGIVKNATDFGVFVSMQGAPDGLLHKNNLPQHLKNNFKDIYSKGKKVKVKVEQVTNKGIQLKLV